MSEKTPTQRVIDAMRADALRCAANALRASEADSTMSTSDFVQWLEAQAIKEEA